jgi:putative ABC transport system ATP-binding protein
VTPVVDLRGVSRTVTLPDGSRLDVLRHADLTVRPGEVVAVRGRSGAGKSTLLNIVGLLDTPTTGTYHCFGRDALALDDRARSRLRGASIGFVFQAYQLLDRRTAVDNVAEPLLYAGWRAVAGRRQAARAALARVDLADRADSMPHQLSGGEQQRVSLARALIRGPQIVLADEPTGSLDGATGDLVVDLLIGLARSAGTAVVIVTHDAAVAARADRTVAIEAGVLDGAA